MATDDRAARLSAARRALFERERARRAARSAGPIARVAEGEPAPLSFAQERFWFLQRLEPTTTEYVLLDGGWIFASIDAAVMSRALRRLTERHAILRTVFPLDGDAPVQVVRPARDLEVPVHELVGATHAERTAEAERHVRLLARVPFDLERGPLLRAALLRADDEAFVFLVAVHHVVSDGISQTILLRDLLALYQDELGLEAEALPTLPFGFADFAAWQRERFDGDRATEHVEAWRAMLAGAPSGLDLPTDRPRPALKQHDGELLRRELPRDLRARSEPARRRPGRRCSRCSSPRCRAGSGGSPAPTTWSSAPRGRGRGRASCASSSARS
ncbi:MAG: condensation domain-containing protein [Planctomycetota bacterium]